MGLCMSHGETTPTRAPPPPSKDTALVLLPSGEMREYPPHTATAARVLQDASASADWFLFDADRVGSVAALAPPPLARLAQCGNAQLLPSARAAADAKVHFLPDLYYNQTHGDA
jgi:hypothetical protein